MTEIYVGLALVALVLMAYKVYRDRKDEKKGDDAPPMSDPLPPIPVESKKTKTKGTKPR